MISAKIIADSKNAFGNRITTFVLVFPRIILAEFNTHRMISRNSASSRAIPFEKMLKSVWKNPFIPIAWMKDHKGMQGNEYFSGVKVWLLIRMWLFARTAAMCMAWILSKFGLTKQICNRLLEPFLWHTVIATGTEWENFFALRAHSAAEIHMQQLAYEMLKAYNNSSPRLLEPGDWHIPFGDNILIPGLEGKEANTQKTIKIATARCARVSYLNFEGKNDYAADVKLHDQLATSGHWSPFEHCARAMSRAEYDHYHDHPYSENPYLEKFARNARKGILGNFCGFIQYRKLFEYENKSDPRVEKK